MKETEDNQILYDFMMPLEAEDIISEDTLLWMPNLDDASFFSLGRCTGSETAWCDSLTLVCSEHGAREHSRISEKDDLNEVLRILDEAGMEPQPYELDPIPTSCPILPLASVLSPSAEQDVLEVNTLKWRLPAPVLSSLLFWVWEDLLPQWRKYKTSVRYGCNGVHMDHLGILDSNCGGEWIGSNALPMTWVDMTALWLVWTIPRSDSSRSASMIWDKQHGHVQTWATWIKLDLQLRNHRKVNTHSPTHPSSASVVTDGKSCTRQNLKRRRRNGWRPCQ